VEPQHLAPAHLVQVHSAHQVAYEGGMPWR
jgi:hypothetical protein